MKRILRLLAAGSLCAVLLSGAVFAEEASGTTASPAEMKAVVLQAGQDFDPAAGESDSKAQLDAAMSKIAEYGMNAVFFPANTSDGALFAGETWPMASSYDLLGYAAEAARAQGLSFYVLFDASCGVDGQGQYGAHGNLSAAAIQSSSKVLGELTGTYQPNGVYLTGYYNQKTAESMSIYRSEGASMGYDNWVRECVSSLVVNASAAVKSAKSDAVFGLVTDPVWANQTTDPAGSATEADFEMATDAYVDLNAIFAWADVDQVMVRCTGSLTDEAQNFKTVLTWWAQTASQYGAGVSAWICNDRLGGDEPGWKAPDQVMRQIIETRAVDGCVGAAYGSLSALDANAGGSTDVLLRYYADQIEEQDILTDLTVSTPEKRTYTTQEPQVNFYGASDPNFPLTLNGKELERNSEGVFSVEMNLEPGLNTFTFEHKEKSVVYKITREVVIIKEVSPSGSMTVEGSTQVGVTVMAYSGSTITASLGGASVTLTEQELTGDTADGNTSSYVPYKGTLTVPAATESQQDVGNITVSGTWSGITQSASGARVYVAALPQQAPGVEGEKGHLVEVTASQARTYPAGVLNNDPNGSCFPLPKGTVDYIVSDKLTYYDDTYGSGEYYILGSGVRVSASSVSSLGEAEWQLSSLSGANSWADGQYVYVSFARSGRKTAYTVSFDGVGYSSSGGVNSFAGATSMVVTLKDTRADTAAPGLASNNLLSGVSLSQQGNDTVIRFDLRKAGSFLGYRAYYDGDNLVFRFNQIPNGLSGAKIYIDPGHGGYDGGTSISGMYTEKALNADIANRVADILRSRGATVQVTDTSGYVSLDSRVNQSQSFSPHLFVSIHHNAGVSSAKGTEVYYFNPYSRQLAANLSGGVAGALGTTNRGDKYGAYRVTTHMEFPAVLVECGFLTNPDELSKLQNDSYKNAIATAIADGIQNTLTSML
ncbi:N-acetylmuramoyl-L-alanine amidase [Candidatus Allofournierella merdipullorum]|uniref:N-acetylmuramoyl-L-alanine amidase n=1 Tax=Candidatus Allofournierella merdipullorum TaxID=2838595 RepID=UPI002A84FE68|nr:N-acetylmuramoyl-L-alanine amidase [Candidatus Fournierella merdipullorum]